jgi:hypothetical protein
MLDASCDHMRVEIQSVICNWPPPSTDQEIDVALTQVAIQHIVTCIIALVVMPLGFLFLQPSL